MYRIDLLRHGETELSQTLRGSTDDALTNFGLQQMQQTVEQSLASMSHDECWQLILSSPLQRCATFATHLARQLQLPHYLHANLQEMHFGDWEAKPTEQIYQQFPEQLAQFWQTPTQFTPPNAESIQVFQIRVLKGLAEIMVQYQHHQAQRALLVTHGGVIKLIKCMALKRPLDDILKMQAELGQISSVLVNEDLSLELLEQNA